jgi:hypothetical protein
MKIKQDGTVGVRAIPVPTMELGAPVKHRRRTKAPEPRVQEQQVNTTRQRLQEWCVSPIAGVPSIEGRGIEFVRPRTEQYVSILLRLPPKLLLKTVCRDGHSHLRSVGHKCLGRRINGDINEEMGRRNPGMNRGNK